MSEKRELIFADTLIGKASAVGLGVFWAVAFATPAWNALFSGDSDDNTYRPSDLTVVEFSPEEG